MTTTAAKKDVDSGWAWMVLVASFMNLLMASGIAFVSGIFQKLFLEQFGQSVAFTAWVTALFSSFMQLAGPLSGMLTSASNCRVTVMVGGALLALGLAASSFATSLEFLFVSFGLIGGIGLGLMYSPSIVIVNFFFDRRRTVIMGLALSASGVGIIASPVLSRFLIDEFSWREALAILACTSAHVCVFGAIMFPMHEPTSKCMLLLHRLLGRKKKKDPPTVAADGGPNGWAVSSEKVSLCEHAAAVDSNLAEPGVEGKCQKSASMGNGESCAANGGVGGTQAEEAHLLGHTDGAGIVDTKEENQIRQRGSGSVAQSSDSPSPTRTAHHHHQYGSRKSLDKISHHLHGSKTQALHPAHHPYPSLSTSAHCLSALHGVGHPSPHHPASRSLLSVEGQATPRGSRLDVRVISTYASIQSLHSIGLNTVEEIVARGLEEEEEVGAGAGGGKGEAASGSDWAIFKNVPFLFLCLQLFLSNMACGIFNIHLPAFSEQRGLDDYDITVVLAVNGMSLFVSRILVGALGHDDKVDKLVVYFGQHFIASFVMAGLPVSTNLAGVIGFTIMMGTYYGSAYSLLTTLTISIVGLPALAFAFGVEMICAGLGYLVAPPLAGWIVDETGDYNNSMYLGAVLMLSSSVAVLCITCCRPHGSPPIGYHLPVSEDQPTVLVQVEGREEEEGEEGVME